MGVESSKQNKFTKSELESLRATWDLIMKNPEENGMYIFQTFLSRHNYYYKFHKFSGVPVNEITQNSFFRKHALLIVNEIHKIVLHLEKESVIKAQLTSLGKIHGKRRVSEEQFEELKEVILEYMRDQFNVGDETIAIWNRTFDLAFSFISEGMRQAN